MRTRYLISVAIASVAGGCAVGPDYVAPSVEKSPAWPTAPSRVAITTDPVIVEWWKTFGDEALTDLIHRAIDANLDLRIARARVAEARAHRGVARSRLLPSVDANASVASQLQSDNARTSIAGDRQSERYETGFDASWEIDVFGGVRRSIEAASADLDAEEEHRRDVMLTVVAEVGRSYVEYREAESRLVIAKRNQALQTQTSELVKSLRCAGRATEVEDSQASSRLAVTSASIPQYEFEAERAWFRIEVLLGAPPNSLTRLTSSSSQLSPPPRVPLGLPGDMLRRRPDVRQAERRLAASTARVGVAVASLYPRFFLTGAVGVRSVGADELVDASSGFWRLGPSVSWPVLEFGRLRRAVDAQDARAEADRARYERTVLLALQESFTALVGFGKEQERLASLSLAAEQSRITTARALERYEAGLEPFLTVLDAQREQLLNEDNVAVSQAELSTRLIALFKSLGGGWETFGDSAEAEPRTGHAVLPIGAER